MMVSKDLNDWLSYSVVPAELTTLLRPAMWGNGQVELMAELKRPCVSEAMCFGYGDMGLTYREEDHLLPAIYDAETSRKYFLYSTDSAEAERATVTFRPDRQIWRYEFDDLDVEVSLFLPRLTPGYLFKLELYPKNENSSTKWHIYHELRHSRGGVLFATEADYTLEGGTVWCRGEQENWEAIGGTLDAERISLGKDGAYATDIMVKTVAERGNQEVVTAYLARAFGGTAEEVRETLTELLSSPERLAGETAEWWNTYLNEVPRLTVPDESFSKNFLWSWPNFRMNRIDTTNSIVPSGQYYNNWSQGLREHLVLSISEHPQGEAVQLLHDPQPARDYILFHLYLTHKKRGLLACDARVDTKCEIGEAYNFPRSDYETLGWFCGLIHKYMLTTGDLTLLEEKFDGKTKVLKRLEEALEARMEYRDEKSGLFFVVGDHQGQDWTGLHGILEASSRFREGGKAFYCDCNAAMWATFIAMAELEELAQNNERSRTYRDMAKELLDNIQRYMWNEKRQFFSDVKLDGSFGDYVGMGGFIAGLMPNHVFRPGGVATKEQAEKLAEWCERPDFAGKYGVVGLASSSPYFDPADFKGHNQGLGIYRQVSTGLYSHGCYEEAHKQLFKIFRRMGENGGLGPRYRGEMYNTDTGEILPWRFHNFTGNLSVLATVVEGVFGMRWTRDALTVHVNSPWPWAKLSNLRIRKSLLDLELMEDGNLVARIDGKEVARSADRKAALPWNSFV